MYIPRYLRVSKITSTFVYVLVICFLIWPNSALIAQDNQFKKIDAIAPKIALDSKDEYVDGEVIVKYKSDQINLRKKAGISKADMLEKGKGIEKIYEFKNLNIRVLKSEKTTIELMAELKDNPDIEYVEPNFKRHPAVIPNDARFNLQWGLNNIGQAIDSVSGTLDADIDAPEAWNLEGLSASDVIIANIDTGVGYAHEDLAGNMWDGSACVDENNLSIFGGCPKHGWNYENGNNDPNDSDPIYPEDHGHGTATAGVIGAVSNNSVGISGMSYRNKIKIMALRFSFDVVTEIKAINFAKNNGAKIINASYVGNQFSQAEKDAIDSFPGLFIAAAGNGGNNLDIYPLYPAILDSPNLISVASTNQNDLLSSFSNYSQNSVDITAPGENITTTYNDGAYVYMNGTSIAVPFVSGAAAMLFSKNPTLNIEQVRYIILNSGDALKTEQEIKKINSGKRLNLSNALSMADNPPDIPNSTPVYRFWSDQRQHHFYTISENEKDYIAINYPPSVWKYESMGFYAFSQAGTNTQAIYRFWSDQKQGHFYTASEDEKDYIIANYPANIWKYEGVGFYAYAARLADTKPVYRFWSDQKQGHFYTASEDEKDYIIANYPINAWKYESIAWYAPTN